MDAYVEFLLHQAASSANILAVTSICNVSCVFCSHAQNPRNVTTYRVPHLSLDAIKSIISYLSADKKVVIGESVTKVYEGEPFSHPQFFEILRLLRGKFPRTVIQITTNGSFLTEQTVSRLVAFMPLELNLSLNSARSETRNKLMRDKEAEISTNSPRLLSQFKIPYHGSIVAMPYIAGWSDIMDSCRFLGLHHAQTIRLFIPGFTQYSPKSLQFDFAEMVKDFNSVIQILRTELQVPILYEPHIPVDLSAEVEGVIVGTVAEKAGIKRGDVIEAINGQHVYSRVDAFNRLLGVGPKHISIIRDKQRCNILLNQSKDERPGIVMYYDIDPDLVEKIKTTVSRKRSETAVVFVSELAFPLWEKVFASEEGITVEMVPSLMFAGSIKAAGLLTVGDYQQAVGGIFSRGLQPDLIFLPQISFDPSGKDLTGVSYLELSVGNAELIML